MARTRSSGVAVRQKARSKSRFPFETLPFPPIIRSLRDIHLIMDVPLRSFLATSRCFQKAVQVSSVLRGQLFWSYLRSSTKSNRSSSVSLAQAETKSWTNFSLASEQA